MHVWMLRLSSVGGVILVPQSRGGQTDVFICIHVCVWQLHAMLKAAPVVCVSPRTEQQQQQNCDGYRSVHHRSYCAADLLLQLVRQINTGHEQRYCLGTQCPSIMYWSSCCSKWMSRSCSTEKVVFVRGVVCGPRPFTMGS